MVRYRQLTTFVDAVDRLLGISTRAGISYAVSVFRRDRNYQDDDAGVEWLAGEKSATALSAVKVISPVMPKPSRWLKRALKQSLVKDVIGIDSIIFLSGPAYEAVTWQLEPKVNQHDVVKFVCPGATGQRPVGRRLLESPEEVSKNQRVDRLWALDWLG